MNDGQLINETQKFFLQKSMISGHSRHIISAFGGLSQETLKLKTSLDSKMKLFF